MGFGEKVRRALTKMKKGLIVYIIVILIGIFFVIAPLSRAVTDAKEAASAAGSIDEGTQSFIMNMKYIITPGENIKYVFTSKYIGDFVKGSFWFIVFAIVFVLVGVMRSLPKNEFTDIENGSSDWATGGEQYKVLNKKKGIILAEKNYLPVDKRGNVNVLVVRRFWCW